MATRRQHDTLKLLLLSRDPAFADALSAPDTADRSKQRIASHDEFNAAYADVRPEGVLRVPDRQIEARIFPDSQHRALEGGLSRVTATSDLASGGNTAIAGHRDSFFRRLEGIEPGALIEISRDGQPLSNVVADVSIVDALDVSPLEETGEEKLRRATSTNGEAGPSRQRTRCCYLKLLP